MSRIKQFWAGFGHVKKGFGFFAANKRLWPYAIMPTLINLAVLALMLYALSHYYSDITTWVFGNSSGLSATETGFFIKIWHSILFGLIYVAKIIIFVILLLLLLLTSFVFSMIITGPFNDLLSEKVEIIITGRGDEPFNFGRFCKSIWRSVVVESGKALFFIIAPASLLFLHLIPLGSILYLILTSLFASYDIGFNFFDLPMGRRLWKFRDRMKRGWGYRYYLTGFGVVALIPLFPYIFAAPMVTGGTLLFCELNSACREMRVLCHPRESGDPQVIKINGFPFSRE